MAVRTYENCSLRKSCIRSGIGDCGIEKESGKCVGYASSDKDGEDGDEPCKVCINCKLNSWYEE